MSFFGLDAVIVYIFLIITLVVGLWCSGEVKNLRDYALGHGEFSSVILFATLSATMVGGYQIVGLSGEVYDTGIIYFFCDCAAILGFIVTFFVMLPKIDSRFKGSLSIADIMDRLYGRIPSKITAVFGIVNCGAILCIQFIALGNVLAQAFSIPFFYGVLGPAIILVVYSTIGGVRSVAMTDLLQFCMLIVMVPLLAKFGLDSNGGITKVFTSVPEAKFRFFSHPDFLQYFFLFMFYSLPAVHLEPAVVQRLLMCKSATTRKKVALSFITMLVFLLVMTLFISFSVLVSSPDVDGSKVFPEAMKTFLPTGLKGLMVAGLLAAIMSTADSCLNTASILTAQLFNFDKEGRKSLLFVKLITILISVVALFVSLRNLNLIRLSAFADLCIAVFINFPLFFGIVCRVEISRYLYYIACAVSACVMLMMFFVWDASILYIPLVGSIISTVILLSKQIVLFNYIDFLFSAPVIVLRFTLRSLIFIIELIKKTPSVSQYCYSTFNKYSASYFVFGLFCVLNYVFPLVNQNYLFSSSFGVNTLLYAAGIVLCITLLMKKHLTTVVSEKAFSIFWVLTLLYCLPFMSVFLFLQNHSSFNWLVNMVLGIMLLASLVPWIMFLFLTVFGSVFAMFASFALTPAGATFDFVDNNFDTVCYTVIASLVIGSIFVRHRQLHQEERTAMMKLFSGAIAHELRAPFAASRMQADMLADSADNRQQGKSSEVARGGSLGSRDGSVVKSSAFQLQRLARKGLQTIEMLLLAVKEDLVMEDYGLYSVKLCIERAIAEYLSANPQKTSCIKLRIDEHEDFMFSGSELFVKHIVLNLLSNSFKHGGVNVVIDIEVVDGVVHFKDNGKGIAQQDLDRIFQKFYTTSESGTGIGLSFCEKAVEKMGGSIECESALGEYALFKLHLPRLREQK